MERVRKDNSTEMKISRFVGLGVVATLIGASASGAAGLQTGDVTLANQLTILGMLIATISSLCLGAFWVSKVASRVQNTDANIGLMRQDFIRHVEDYKELKIALLAAITAEATRSSTALASIEARMESQNTRIDALMDHRRDTQQ
jgi:hypothetical protein